jgi:predicted nucleotidyltransferase
MKFGLSDEILSDFHRVFLKHSNIDRVLIFGSRAKGGYKDGSDIDLAVFAPNMSEQEFVKLWNELDELPLVYKIDCLHWDSVGHQNLKRKIVEEGVLFYEPSS